MATSYPPQQVPVPSVPSTRVELHLSCKKLKDMDLLSKSDPIVSVLVKDAKSGSWREVSRINFVYCIITLYTSLGLTSIMLSLEYLHVVDISSTKSFY